MAIYVNSRCFLPTWHLISADAYAFPLEKSDSRLYNYLCTLSRKNAISGHPICAKCDVIFGTGLVYEPHYLLR